MNRLLPVAGRLVAGALALVLVPSVASAHQGHSMQEPWRVCESAALDAECEWSDDHGSRYIGTCREVSEQLLCVRNQPIVTDHEHHAAHGEGHHHGEGNHRDPETVATATGGHGLVYGGLALLAVVLLGLTLRSRRRDAATLAAARVRP